MEKEIPLTELWIVVEDGDIFAGNIEQWAAYFFRTDSAQAILNHCQDENWKVRLEHEPDALSL